MKNYKTSESVRENSMNYYLANKDRVKARMRQYAMKHRAKQLKYMYCKRHNIPLELYDLYRTKNKWRSVIRKMIRQRLSSVQSRCNIATCNKYEYYGGRGIKCFLTANELEFIYHRDNAASMKKPSIDRIDNDGHYELSNCRFIEMTKNRRGISIRRTNKPIKPTHCYWCGKKNPKPWTKFCSHKCAMNSARLAWLERNKKSKGAKR